MGKKNRNKRRDDKNAKSKAKPSNDEAQKKAETTTTIEPRIVIEIDASTPESPNKTVTCTTVNNLGISYVFFYRIYGKSTNS